MAEDGRKWSSGIFGGPPASPMALGESQVLLNILNQNFEEALTDTSAPGMDILPLTLDVQLFFHVLDVNGGFLLNEIQDFDGVGHPEKHVLKVREKVCDGKAGKRHWILLADKTDQELKGV